MLIPMFTSEFSKYVRVVEAGLCRVDDEHLWRKVDGIPNTLGALVRHLTGNLNHFFGSVLQGSGYIRDKADEFAVKCDSRDELRDRFREAVQAMQDYLNGLIEADIDAKIIVPDDNNVGTIGQLLVKLLAHFSYHSGEITYLSRTNGTT